MADLLGVQGGVEGRNVIGEIKQVRVPDTTSNLGVAAAALSGAAQLINALRPDPQEVLKKKADEYVTKTFEIEQNPALNTAEKGRMKRELENRFYASAGPEGASFAKGQIEMSRLERKTTLTGGSVLVDQAGNLVEVDPGTIQGQHAIALSKQVDDIETVFPNIAAQGAQLFGAEFAANPNSLRRDGIVSVTSKLAEGAGAFNQVRQRFVAIAPTLTDKAQQDIFLGQINGQLMQAVSSTANALLDPYLTRTVKGSGPFSAEDAAAWANTVRADLYNEAAQTAAMTGADIAPIRSYIDATVDNAIKVYQQSASIDDLERMRSRAQIQNDMTKEVYLSQNPDIIRMTAAKPAIEGLASMVDTIQGLESAAMQSSNPPLKVQAQAASDVLASRLPSYTGAVGQLTDSVGGSRAQLQNVDTIIQNSDSRDEFLYGLENLSKISNKKEGAFYVKEVTGRLPTIITKGQELVQSGEITQQELDMLVQNIKGYEQSSIGILKSVGMTDQHASDIINNVGTFHDQLVGSPQPRVPVRPRKPITQAEKDFMAQQQPTQ